MGVETTWTSRPGITLRMRGEKRSESAGITYERTLRNLVVAMYGHYVDLFQCHSATVGHRIVLAYNCLEVAAKLGHYNRAVRRRQPGEELLDWIPTPEIPAGDRRLDYVDVFTLLGNAMHPTYGHPIDAGPSL